ncbi:MULTISPECIES: DUF2889 domain-containing protein [Paraburkholderia]|uniref:DUF2889 domain-containing protein n=1 Tax=Paraburkholderia TaxID=1822464 RepID=UPI002257354E|nr:MULTISPECIES: DUF2889 domain-containing protein [Paraburkholderia]MCX4161232.1 DUF2889 domain-containing protein [Paraburkholderia megapolitana]MDN7156728.1 DUF2889 domain-containing protein [Paraburkholderia sp. CHISQ3]MDQ6493773.1 DUF2889 domain-containing protein [Paraburkholderia megapolitana]
MPLSPPVSRQLRHRRAIHAEAYERADGLWDIEACLTDQKPRDVALASGVRPNGLPIHELWLRITIDSKLTVVDAETSSDWVPYPGQCETANSAYRALIGLNLLNNFRRDATRLLAGTAGCTHLTELCAVLPTAAIQAFAGDVWNTKNGGPDGKHEQGSEGHASNGTDNASSTTQPTRSIDKPPFQLGRCHALRFDGEAVRQFYPRWHGHAPRSARAAAAGEPCANAAANAANANDTTDTSDKNSNQVQSNSQTEGNHA